MSNDPSVASGDGPYTGANDQGPHSDLVVNGRVVETRIGHDDVVRAAGCVVYRHGPDGSEVLVVHRPRYDDWDLPKGKREGGESDIDCALRETEEESGYRGEIEEELPADAYRVRGRDKVVRWFLMRCTDGSFEPNNEVDEIRWLSPGDAREVLSYGHARSLVDFVPAVPADAGPADTGPADPPS